MVGINVELVETVESGKERTSSSRFIGGSPGLNKSAENRHACFLREDIQGGEFGEKSKHRSKW